LHLPLIPAERTGMSTVPKVFISATSGDLRSVRQIAKEALLSIGCHPGEQTNFEPDWRTVSAPSFAISFRYVL